MASITLERGEFFGEASALFGAPRTATFVAYSEAVQCLALEPAMMRKMLGPLRDVLHHNLVVTLLRPIPALAQLSNEELEEVVTAMTRRVCGVCILY